MSMHSIKLLVTVLIIVISRQLYGQGKSFNAENYTTQNGLPQNSVKDIEEDRWGFIWMTTEMGLVRFDGKDFKVFGLHNTPGLSTDRMQLIATDKNGTLYAHESNPAVMQIALENKRYAPVPKVIEKQAINLPAIGYAVSESVFNPKTTSQIRKKLNVTRIDLRLPGFYGADSRQAYFEYETDLFYVNGDRFSIIEEKGDEWLKLTLVEDLFIKILKNNRIKVWQNGRVDTRFFQIHGSLSQDPYFLKGDFKIFWSKGENFIYSNNQLHRLYRSGNSLFSEIVLTGLDIPGIISLCYSKAKNTFFIGSEIKGLFVIKPASFQYPAVPDKTISEVFYSQAIIDSGKIFANNILLSQTNLPKVTPYLVDRESVSFHTNRKELIFYERRKTFYSFDFKNRKEKKVMDLDGRLVAIVEEPTDSSLFLFTDQSVFIIRNGRLLYQAKTGHAIQHAIRIKDDQFLLCTQKGVKWYHVRTNTTTGSILDSLSIRTAFQDEHKRWWISSYGKGFYLYDYQKVYAMPLDPKGALRTVHSYIGAEPGYFWLPTNDGLFRVARQELLDYAYGRRKEVYYFLFSQKDGLRTTEFNGGCDPSYLKLPDGMLSLPSLEGLVWFYPEKIKPVFPDKQLFIDHILVNEEPQQPGEGIDLEPDFSQFDMLVTSPFFGNKENILIEYRISELKDEWSPVQENGVITLNNVRSGNYQIQVRKRNGASQHGYDYLNFGVTVKPFFYNTWWFYALAAALLAVAVYFFMRYRFRVLKKRSEELEKLVAARTLQLNDKIGELSQSQNSLEESNKVKDRMITLVLHDLRSPIRFLNTISNYLSRNYQSLTKEDLKRSTDELKGSTTALNHFTEHFFAWINSHRENFTVVNECVSINSLFTDVRDLYEEIIRNEGNVILIEPTEIGCYTDKHILDAIIRNLVDNANKNSNRGIISLSAKAFNDRIEIYVSDTGEGLSDEQIAQINKGILADKGIGLTIIIDLLDKIGGRLSASRGSEKGCVFRVTIPVLPISDEA